LIVICTPPITSSSIFQPETSTTKGLGLKSSTHSGIVASEPVFGINSLTRIVGELESAAAGYNISAVPHPIRSSEIIRRERTGIVYFPTA